MELNGQEALVDPDQLLTPKQVAQLLHVQVDTLSKWRQGKGGNIGPAYVKLGRVVRYKRRDIQNYTESRTFPHTAAAHFASVKSD